jgi:hypothetical protein
MWSEEDHNILHHFSAPVATSIGTTYFYIPMYINIYKYTYVFILLYTYIHIFTHIYIYIYTYTYLWIYIAFQSPPQTAVERANDRGMVVSLPPATESESYPMQLGTPPDQIIAVNEYKGIYEYTYILLFLPLFIPSLYLLNTPLI